MSNCLIIAAGMGSRMQSETPKPLLEVHGISLIEHVIRINKFAGVENFYVVTGYRGEEIRAHLDGRRADLGINIEHVINHDYQRGNGLSVTAAKQRLREPFILTMSDHLYEPSVVSDLLRCKDSTARLILAVDSNTDNPEIDLDDVTRVYQKDGAIQQIGKGLFEFNCFDTGVFYCHPELFNAIEESVAAAGDESLSGGVRMLARSGDARIMDIGNRFWCDVDKQSELRQAHEFFAKRTGQFSSR
ncbi:MAG: phosphocholine cytidylyltransferase family protein [Pseudomonadota bacterium]